MKFENGYFNHQSGSVMPLPTSCVECNEIGFQECFIIEQCPFYGLGFSHVWLGKLASCKHLYHYWCAIAPLQTKGVHVCQMISLDFK
jgi:hypothetical protein